MSVAALAAFKLLSQIQTRSCDQVPVLTEDITPDKYRYYGNFLRNCRVVVIGK